MSLSEQYLALHEAAAVVDRSSRGALLLTGADRRSYLQGLLTNDILALTPGQGCYAAYLTPQGRMIADMRVFESGDALLVDLDATRAPAVADRWSQFIFSEDVQVEDISARTVHVGIYGPHAAQALARGLGDLIARGDAPPADQLERMAMHDNVRIPLRDSVAYVLRSDDIGVPGFDIVVPLGSDLDLRKALGGEVSADSEAVEACRIEAGRPLFGVDMDEDTIPLEAGIEDRAISFTKGCYVGQEIVIRVMHRGHGRVAKKLVRLRLEQGAAVPPRGARLSAGDREIGAITSAAFSPSQQRAVALGYVHRDFAAEGTGVAVRHEAALLFATVEPLPAHTR